MKLMCPVVGAVGVLVNAYVYNLSHTVQLVRHRALQAIPTGLHAFAGGIRAHMVASLGVSLHRGARHSFDCR